MIMLNSAPGKTVQNNLDEIKLLSKQLKDANKLGFDPIKSQFILKNFIDSINYDNLVEQCKLQQDNNIKINGIGNIVIREGKAILRFKNIILGSGAGGKVSLGLTVFSAKSCSEIGDLVADKKIFKQQANEAEIPREIVVSEKVGALIFSYKKTKNGSNRFHLVLPYVDGPTLYKRMCDKKILATSEKLSIMQSMAKELHKKAHSNNVSHNDAWVNNWILNEKNNKVTLIDWGNATFNGEAHYKRIGNPTYFSPEIFKNTIYSSKSDVYYLAIDFFELLHKELSSEKLAMPLPWKMDEIKNAWDVFWGPDYEDVNVKKEDRHQVFDKMATDNVRVAILQNLAKNPEIELNETSRQIVDLLIDMLNAEPSKRPTMEMVINTIKDIRNNAKDNVFPINKINYEKRSLCS